MKTKIAFFIFTLCLPLFYSCNNAENVSEDIRMEDGSSLNDSIREEFALLDLQNDIVAYNKAFFSNNSGGNIETRGWWSRLWKRIVYTIVTVTADVMGGAAGAAVGGAWGAVGAGTAASGFVGGLLFSDNATVVPFKTPRRNSNGNVYDLSQTSESVSSAIVNSDSLCLTNVVPMDSKPMEDALLTDSIGYYHNKTLYSIFSDSLKYDAFSNMSQSEQTLTIIDNLKEYSCFRDMDRGNVSDEEIADKAVEISNLVVQYANESETESEFFDKLKSSGLLNDNTLDILKTVIDGLMQLDVESEDGEYYENVLKIIDEADIDDDMKLQLRGGVIIGQASNRLWVRSQASMEE